LTVSDQLRTVARQCYAWTLPYGVSFAADEDVRDGRIVSEALARRVEMFVHDVRVYGALLARQRHLDLAGTGPGFMAKHRKKAGDESLIVFFIRISASPSDRCCSPGAREESR